MAGQRISAQEIVKYHAGEIAMLRKMGISDYAILTYIVRVQEGRSKGSATEALLQGRQSLSEEQKHLIRVVLSRFP